MDFLEILTNNTFEAFSGSEFHEESLHDIIIV